MRKENGVLESWRVGVLQKCRPHRSIAPSLHHSAVLLPDLNIIWSSAPCCFAWGCSASSPRSEEHTSELQSLRHLVCRLLLEKKHNNTKMGRRHDRDSARWEMLTYGSTS